MDLTGSDGQQFHMTVVGYQFPDLASAEYDSNWLNVTVRVAHPKGRWRSTDPSLLTYEAASLARWLEAASLGGAVESEESFTEPNLRFQLVGVAGRERLRVHLDAEYLPPWVQPRVAGETDVFVEFPLEDVNLLEAARALRDQLERYPQRAER